MKNNKCIACGTIIPEGRQVCPNCESRPFHLLSMKPLNIDVFARKLGVQIAEKVDNEIMAKIIEIAKEQGCTDLLLINKEFVAEAIEREMERRSKL